MSLPALVYSPEQEELRATVRRFCEQHFSPADVRRELDSPDGYDATVWKQMARELGLAGLAVPEEHGGSGATVIEVVAVAEELGRALAGGPWFATACLAVAALVASDDSSSGAELLAGIAEGSVIATVAFAGEDDSWSDDGLCVSARSGDGAFHLSGSRTCVLNGLQADVVLVLGATAAGPSLFAVDTAAAGVLRRPLRGLDLTRRLAEVSFDDAPARLVGSQGDGARVIAEVLSYAAVVLAAESAGGAQRCVEMSAAYARERVQFGRVIGSFQAIKHLCADMVVESEGAQAAYRYGAWALAEEWPDVERAVAVAQLHCPRAYSSVAAETIQVHGGIGFTWEHDAHLHLRRAKVNELLLAPRRRRQLFETSLGL